MISTKLASISLAAALFSVLPAVQAKAQAIRTFVSVAGSDTNPCSITQPCRHFQAAVNATALGGEVDALDPGAYGSFTISQAVTIEGQGWSYVAPPANGNAITINAGSGNVTIRGVSLNGVGATGNTVGIMFNTGASLTVRDSVVQNFGSSGIQFAPNTSTLSQLFVSNTAASDNSSGIVISPSGSGTTKAVLNHVEAEHNGTTGIVALTGSQTINVTVSDSVSANNGVDGIFAESDGATSVKIMVRNSTIANNAGNGLESFNTGATIRFTRSTITGNGTAWVANASGVVTSYNDNNIDDNGSANTAPPQIGYK
jgi:hypothetical protein